MTYFWHSNMEDPERKEMLDAFLQVGIPLERATEYESLFFQHKVDMSLLQDLSQEVLREMGIELIGDRLKLLRLKVQSPNYFSKGPVDFQNEDILYHNLLGRGSFGDVYSCTLKYSGGSFAAKRCYLVPGSAVRKETFLQELHLLQKLNHPNIVKV